VQSVGKDAPWPRARRMCNYSHQFLGQFRHLEPSAKGLCDTMHHARANSALRGLQRPAFKSPKLDDATS
jgi:hypothetical protein